MAERQGDGVNFKPKSEKEIQEAQLLPAGEYDFDVLESEDARSKSGNDMIKVKLGIYNGDRITSHIFDYLMPAMEAKLRHFCDTAGLLAEYESGSLTAEMCKGRSGKAKVIIQEDKTGQYPSRNSVKDYTVRAAKPLATTSENEATGKPPDDLPF